MSEFKRLFGRKTVFMLLALVIIHVGLFMMSLPPKRILRLREVSLKAIFRNTPSF